MNHDPTTYRNLAAAIADPAIQSRIGFGAFGKYSTLFERTHRLITKSSLLAQCDMANSTMRISFATS